MIAVSVSAVAGLSGFFKENKVLADEQVYTLTEGSDTPVPFGPEYTKCIFIPEASAYYEIMSVSDYDTYAQIGNAGYDVQSYGYFAYSWGTSFDRDFRIVTYLEANTQYDLYVMKNDYSDTASEYFDLPIRITRIGTTGSCGDSATWTYDAETATLTISGSGEMYDYRDQEMRIWRVYRTDIEKVVVENGITKIGAYAFYDMPNLISASVPDSVKRIEYDAFAQCKSLAAIPAMNGVEYLGDAAFYWCESITEVTVPDNITSMGNYVFGGCSNLTTATLGTGMTKIAPYEFSTCGNLTSVTIPECVTEIGQYAFSSCQLLPGVTIPENVTSIGDWAFNGCCSMTSIDIPEKVDYIGEGAFSSCTALTSIEIPEGVTEIKGQTFNYCTNLETVILPEGIKSIGYQDFCYCTKLRNINFPSTLKSIGGEAFLESDLETVVFPDSLESIDYSAFSGCDILTNVTFGSGLKTIGTEAFAGCDEILELIFPDGLESIGNDAFRQLFRLKTLSIPSGSIGNGAFRYCEGITSLTLGPGVTSIGDSAFLNDSGFTTLILPSSLTAVGPYAFYNCDGIVTLTIPEGITAIGDYAFYDCDHIPSLDIPGSVKTIGNYAFFSCNSIADIVLEDGVREIWNSAFESCISLMTVTLPGSVKYIGYSAFLACEEMTDIYCYINPEYLQNWWARDEFARDRATKCHVLSCFYDRFVSDYEDYINVTFVGDLDEAINMNLGAAIYGYTLSLEGDIGVNFYMDLSGTELSNDAYMKFTIPNGNSTSVQKVYVKDALQKPAGEKTCHVFKCRVSPKDAASPIKAQLIDGENSSKVFSYSVRQYAEYLYSHRYENDEYERAARLVQALMCYCTCAQDYFAVAREFFDYTWKNFYQIENVAIDAPEKIVALDNVPGVTFVGAKLSLRSETELKLYFLCEDDTTFSCANGDIETITDGEYKVVVVRNINARDIGKSFQIKAIRGTNSGLVQYSILNYCDSVVNSSEYTDLLKDTVRSLVYYYHETVKYAANGGSNNA